tara:strand:+ start:298 stop:2106 length:1809 start_codon:yes stop_codon:yes gene_type:complete
MYQSIWTESTGYGTNTYRIWVWDDEHGLIEGYEWDNEAYVEDPNGTYTGLNGKKLIKTKNYVYNVPSEENGWGQATEVFDRRTGKYKSREPNTLGLHYADVDPAQKFILEHYKDDDTPSQGHSEMFFDIECEIVGALTEENIQNPRGKITSIAWYHRQEKRYGCLILDPQAQIQNKPAYKKDGYIKEIISCQSEYELLDKFLAIYREINPRILIGYNSDFFDVPYLYYRIMRVLGEGREKELSEINKVKSQLESSRWLKRGSYVDIAGVESLDYMRLHKKFGWKDEESWALNAIGEKYVNLGKVDYEGNLDDLYKKDINKYIEYNFRDVEILVKLDEKFQYIDLVKNLSHKGKHRYQGVYSNSLTQDGAISAYLFKNNIIPPNKATKPMIKKNYAGGYLFCPKAGKYDYVFDLDYTSLYPSIIMELNIGKETYKGRIVDSYDRNNYLSFIDLKKMDPNKLLVLEKPDGEKGELKVSEILDFIESKNLSITANGVMFSQRKQSLLSVVLERWFNERVEYKNKMKEAYKANDKEKGEYYFLMQYTMKILLNSLYGATALPRFRYGNVILAESITLTGQRLIQASAYHANYYFNNILNGKEKLEL